MIKILQKFALTLIIVVLLLPFSTSAIFTGTSGDADTASEESRSHGRAHKTWSVLVYVDGDNNLEKFAVEDVNEMETVGSTDDVNIVVQVDRVPGYDKSNGDWTDTRRFYITKDNDTDLISSEQIGDPLGELNMAASDTLQNFIEWGITNYPAEHYLVVMWDHGRGIFRSTASDGGLFRGFNEDKTSNTQEMKLWELDEIMKYIKGVNSGKSIDLLAFDQCWLGNVETAYELMDSVDFLIASADEEPDKGWNYQPPLSKLVANPDMTPKEFAIQVTNDYVEEYSNKSSYDYMTQVTVDLNELNKTFVPLMNEFSKALMDSFYEYQSTLFGIRNTMSNYYYPHPDLFYFVELVAGNTSLPDALRQAARNLQGNYSHFILAEGHGDAHPNAHGLAVYFPESIMYNAFSTWQQEYDTNIDFSQELWSEFLHMFHNPVRISHEVLRDTEDTRSDYTAVANITGHMLDEDNIWLAFSKNGNEFTTINMTGGTVGSEFEADIPRQLNNTDIYYYIEALDQKGNRVYAPENAPTLALKDLHHFYVGTDHVAPAITHNTLGNKEYSKDDFEITVTVTDNIAVDPTSVKMFYRLNNEKNHIELIMAPLPHDASVFRAFIPPQLIGTTVYYHFSAMDDARYPNTKRLPVSGDFQFRILGMILNIGRDDHHSGETSDYYEFNKTLMSPGYNITEIDHSYSASLLEDIDMVVITEPDKEFSATELTILDDYLIDGGRLIVIAGDSVDTMNNLTGFLGIHWLESQPGEGYTGSFATVPAIFDNVQELFYSDSHLALDVTYPSTKLIEDDLGTSAMAAYSYRGQGKVVALTRGFFNSDSINVSNNKQFLNNIGLWLVKCPIAVVLGPDTRINGEHVTGITNFTINIWEDDFVGFDGGSSVYPEFNTTGLNYTWHFGSGVYSYEKKPAYKYTDEGTFQVEMTVRTYDSFTDTAKLTVRVNNVLPQAFPGYTKIAGLTVYFNGSESEDSASDVPKMTYHWDFGDGENATGCDPIHSYKSKGVYYAILTVTDDNGATSVVSLKVDLGGDDDASLGTYVPAIAAIIILIIILVLYGLMQRKNAAKKDDCKTKEEDRVEQAPVHKRTVVRRKSAGTLLKREEGGAMREKRQGARREPRFK